MGDLTSLFLSVKWDNHSSYIKGSWRKLMYYVKCLEDMPGDSAIKNPHANVGDEGSIPR